MAITIKQEGWESGIGAGWTSSGNIATSTAFANGGTHSLTHTDPTALDTIYWASDTDGNNGDAQTTTDCYFPTANDGIMDIYCRIQSAPATTCYRAAIINGNGGGSGGGVYLWSKVGGSQSPITSIVASTDFAASTWYTIRLTTSGSSPVNLTIRVIRGDGQYYDVGGGWTASPTNCITTTDSALGSGQGYAGLRFNYSTSGTNTVYADNFLFESLAAAPPTITYYTGLGIGMGF